MSEHEVMNTLVYQPDKLLLAETRNLLDQCASKQGDIDTAEAALEALGTLIFSGSADEARDRAARDDLSWLADEVGAVLGGTLAERLDDAMTAVAALAPKIRSAEPDSTGELEERLLKALAYRDKVELVLAGADVVFGVLPELPMELEVSLASFEDMVEPMLWQTLLLGPRREERSTWCAPKMRKRLWWWHRGADLPHDALEHLETAARVIHAFPEAREELERLIRSEELLQQMAARGAGELGALSLAEHFEGLARGRGGDENERLALAAAPEDEEKTLLEHEALTIAYCQGTLIVDLEQDPDMEAAHPVILEVPGQELLAGTPGEVNSFTFDLADPRFQAREGRLCVYLVSGAVHLGLPLELS